jgi:hypothetical protein
VGNEENEYPVPDTNRLLTMSSTMSIEKFSKRMNLLRYSWRSYKRQLNGMYRMNSSNIKTPQIKSLRRYRNI